MQENTKLSEVPEKAEEVIIETIGPSDGEEEDESSESSSEETIQKMEIKNVPIIQEIIEEANDEVIPPKQENQENQNETTYKNETQKTSLQVPNGVVLKRKELGRSKSSQDIKAAVVQNWAKNVRPKSGIDTRNRTNPGNKPKPIPANFLLNPNNDGNKFKSSVKTVIRRHSESKFVTYKEASSKEETVNSGSDRRSNSTVPTNPRTRGTLQKSESSISLNSLPDRVLTATVTKIQSNLHRLHNNNNSDTKHSLERMMNRNNKIKNRNDNRDLESPDTSSVDSDTDSDSTTLSTANLESKHRKNLNDQRIPFSTRLRPSNKDNKIISPTMERGPTGILREQGPNFLAELDGRELRLYGSGALKCIELPWEKSATISATTIHFQYINFEEIIDIFPRLRTRFPNLENFIFVETNIRKRSQLNALAELHQVNSIFVKKEGNPLNETGTWRLYAIFRLSHWGLSVINGDEVIAF